MTQQLCIALAQLNLNVGDLAGNKEKILASYRKASEQGADLVVYSELTITGYAPEDLVLRSKFQQDSLQMVYTLAEATKGNNTAMLVGGLSLKDGKLHNSAFLLEEGEVKVTFSKYDLPNYGVFDEKRVFSAAPLPQALMWRGIKLGIIICEDTWNLDVARAMAAQNIELLISINASPYEIGKRSKRLERTRSNVAITHTPIIYINQICGQDDVIYDGGSFVLDAKSNIATQLPHWKEALQLTQWEKQVDDSWKCLTQETSRIPEHDEGIYQAMILGLKDYSIKNRFSGILIGISGGIDSALTAAIAVDAIGASNVWCIMMPSEFTSQQSIDDATTVANNLGVKYDVIPIGPAFQAMKDMLTNAFTGMEEDTTEENLQSRVRGTLLMALSNKFGYMVLSTGNKSEVAVGYSTLYGDMCGGYNVLKDVYKTEVFALARWRNTHFPEGAKGPEGLVIPDRVINKAPSAELRHGQKDEDSLPPYYILDNILYQLIEQRRSAEEIIANGHEKEIVDRVVKLVYLAEYKRRQAPPGVKTSTMQFGRDRRYPITHNYMF